MKELVVISGKGGTGKTSIVAALSSVVKNKILVDCDVDASDLFLILQPDYLEKTIFYAGQKAIIDKSKCNSCKKCIVACKFEAITKEFEVTDFKCEGCGVCRVICPQNAVIMKDSRAGEWYISQTRLGKMLHAKLGIAEDNSGKLVATIRNKAKDLAKKDNNKFIITDGPPGIACPVISSVSGTNAVLIVTEPTQSGIHDFTRVSELIRQFKIRAYACINKYDINNEISREIEKYCKNNNIKIIAKIPYTKDFNRALLDGKTILEYGSKELSLIIKNMWETIEAEL